MSEPTVDVLPAMDAQAEGLAAFVGTLKHPRYEKTKAEAEAVLSEFLAARAAVAELIAERDSLRWALSEYPRRNPHQLQARKVCKGVAALARAGGALDG